MAIFHSDSDDALHAIIPGLTHVEAPAPPSAPRAGEVQRVKTTTFVLIDWPRHELSPGLLLRLAVLPRSQGEGHDVVLIDRFRDLRPDLRRKSRKLRTLDRSSPSPLLAVARLSLATTGSPSLARELLLQLRDLSLERFDCIASLSLLLHEVPSGHHVLLLLRRRLTSRRRAHGWGLLHTRSSAGRYEPARSIADRPRILSVINRRIASFLVSAARRERVRGRGSAWPRERQKEEGGQRCLWRQS